MKKIRDILIRVFVVILGIFMITVFARIIIKNIVVEKLNISNGFTRWALHGVSTVDAVDEVTGELFANIDWEGMYPHKNVDSDKAYVITKSSNSLLDGYKQKVGHIEGIFSDYCNTYLAWRTFFVEKAFGYDKAIGWYITSSKATDGIVNLTNGYLSQSHGKTDVTPFVKRAVELKEYANSNGIDFLYIQAPSKIAPKDKMLPAGMEDYSNENADDFLRLIEEKDVETLDLRLNMYDIAEDYYGAFYKTDHHWKTTTAFKMAGKIAETLNDRFGYEFDSYYYDVNNYNVEHYEKVFLGSLGKKVTLSMAEPEDYDLMVPKFDANFSVKIPERYIDMEGSFKDTLLDYRHLQKIDYYNENCYASFMNRNDAVGTVHNMNPTCNKSKKILMIKDSYSTPVVPYLALGVEDMELMYEIRYTGSVKSYIDEVKPDIVIVMYSADNFYGDGSGMTVPFHLE